MKNHTRLNHKSIRVLFFTVLCGLAASCTQRPGRITGNNDGGVGGDASRDSSGQTDTTVNPVNVGTVRGTLRFPKGNYSVPGALIYTTYDEATPLPSGECGQCRNLGDMSSHTYTNTDGTFTLTNVPVGPHKLFIEKGLFRRELDIVVVNGQEIVLTDDQARLPRRSSEGYVPQIAVMNGEYDEMERVIRAVGMDSAMTIFPKSQLLTTVNNLGSYDYLFLNCGDIPQNVAQNTGLKDQIKAFVARGGRLFITDWAYDVVEETYPERIDFVGGSNGLSATPERFNAGRSGDEVESIRATVQDDDLRNWLIANGAMAASATQLQLVHFLQNWVEMDAVSATSKVWFQSSERPMTITFESGCGRTLYSSYHTAGDEASEESLVPQELALVYLALEIGSCIREPVIL